MGLKQASNFPQKKKKKKKQAFNYGQFINTTARIGNK
jgi:hypothetical protein